MEDVMKLAEDLYLVHGKVIRGLDHGMFDGTDGQKALFEIADGTLQSTFCPVAYGDLTVFGFRVLEDDLPARRLLSSQSHFSSLPEDVKVVLRKEFLEHAGEF